MRYSFCTVDVFTRAPFSGNQLAVFPDAVGLRSEQMQLIAREFNLSETAFVLPPQNPANTRRLRIFTPETELPFAGHPTIGSAFVLAAIGDLVLTGRETHIVFEEEVGPLKMTIRSNQGQPEFVQFTAAAAPEFGPEPPPPDALAAVLSLKTSDIMSGKYFPQAVSCGVPFLFIPLKYRLALKRARVDRNHWQQTLGSFWAPHIYALYIDPDLPAAPICARMFAPALGVEEDPATGSAATALAAYLAARDKTSRDKLDWVVEQGVEMGRRSIIEVEAERQGSAIRAIRVGGSAVLVSKGEMDIPDAL